MVIIIFFFQEIYLATDYRRNTHRKIIKHSLEICRKNDHWKALGKTFHQKSVEKDMTKDSIKYMSEEYFSVGNDFTDALFTSVLVGKLSENSISNRFPTEMTVRNVPLCCSETYVSY